MTPSNVGGKGDELWFVMMQGLTQPRPHPWHPKEKGLSPRQQAPIYSIRRISTPLKTWNFFPKVFKKQYSTRQLWYFKTPYFVLILFFTTH